MFDFLNKKKESFSSDNDDFEKEVKQYHLRIIGLTFLIWGCMLYLVDSTIVGNLFLKLPVIKNFFRSSNGSLDLSISSSKSMSKLPTLLSATIIFIGMVLVLHAHEGLKAQITMILCPIFYTLGFVFLIAMFQQTIRPRKNVCGLIFIACILIGAMIQGMNKDEFDEPDEE